MFEVKPRVRRNGLDIFTPSVSGLVRKFNRCNFTLPILYFVFLFCIFGRTAGSLLRRTRSHFLFRFINYFSSSRLLTLKIHRETKGQKNLLFILLWTDDGSFYNVASFILVETSKVSPHTQKI